MDNIKNKPSKNNDKVSGGKMKGPLMVRIHKGRRASKKKRSHGGPWERDELETEFQRVIGTHTEFWNQ
jgi:hypothetical protein